jgi:hypothetical protein
VNDLSFVASQMNLQPEIKDIVDGANLDSLDPFRHRKFKLKSTGAGPPGPLNLEAMVLCNEIGYNRRSPDKHPCKKNLNEGERKARRYLERDDSIVIKPADKGSAVVVQDRSDYPREGYRQLSDSHFYQEVDEDLTEKHRREIQNFVEEMYQNGEIDLRVRNYLADKTCRISRFYLLPKIHKKVNLPPGRPVVSGNGSPTEKISHFVDHFLNLSIPSIKSYVKDTTHFLQIFRGNGTFARQCNVGNIGYHLIVHQCAQ